MTHSFHIPVLGLAFSIDTAIKVAQYGISSVISLVDDDLLERMRAYYSKLYQQLYQAIPKHEEDARAKRITAYLDLVHDIVEEQMQELKYSDWSTNKSVQQYIGLLANEHPLTQKFSAWMDSESEAERLTLAEEIRQAFHRGNIDVNIMSKVDKINYSKNGEALDATYSDASAAIRGFANSKLSSSVVLSAGMNPQLYAYLGDLAIFLPNASGQFSKKITLKVSDYRSALIQAKYLAKRGIWVSEFRIESGLNCGGHAFATEGFLLGPILDEFSKNKPSLIAAVFAIYQEKLAEKNLFLHEAPQVLITVQGGVGTAAEHQFLLSQYEVDAVGWGSPFLLVPEATTVDDNTLKELIQATKEDFYLSNASPLGVPFHNFKRSTGEQDRLKRIAQGRPGYPCSKKYLVSDKTYTEKPVCTASRVYQAHKIKELEQLELPNEEFKKQYDQLVEKQCLCEGLASAAYLKYSLLKPKERQAVAICPGPNTVYFKQQYTLKEMVDHIYGRINVLQGVERPSMFINELELYVQYLSQYIQANVLDMDLKKTKYINRFNQQLLEGISYYRNLHHKISQTLTDTKDSFLESLNDYEIKLKPLII